MILGRRKTIIGGIVGAGFISVGWWFARDRDRLGGTRDFNVKGDESALNAWVKIDQEDQVIVAIPRAEMGQGVQTALAMLVAEEMDARWDQVRVEDPPDDPIYRNVVVLLDALPFSPEAQGILVDAAHWATSRTAGILGISITGGSSSVRDAFLPMRTAGAVARDLLLQAASRKSGIGAADLTISEGEIRRRDGAPVARLGQLVGSMGDLRPVPTPKLKDPSQFKLLGRPLPRLDVPAKVRGTATFGIDVRQPRQLYAAVRNAPTFGGAASGFNLDGALPKGIEKAVIVPGGVAAIGASWWQANKFLDEGLAITWEPGPAPKLESADLWRRHEGLLDKGTAALTRTSGDEARARNPRYIEATYRAPYLAHATMEPVNCTACVSKGAVEIWMPNQSPTLVRRVAARMAGVDISAVTVHTTFLGGGFGRRFETDLVRQAVTCALAMPGRPVQVLWSREEDIRHDFFRPMALARWRAELDTSNGTPRLVGVAKRQVGQSSSDAFTLRAFGLPALGQPEGNAVENPPYAFPSYRLEAIVADEPVPVGFWRSVGHSHSAFFDESFIDELAIALGKDPFAYRRELLAEKPRHLKVLETAAREAGWGAPLPPGHGRGIALRASFGSIVAQVAEVMVDGDSLRVLRVTCAVDCGPVIQPQIVSMQMESGIIFGLSAALHGEITVSDGRVEQSNFSDYEVVKLADAPSIAVHIVESDAVEIGGVGEPGTPPIAPAVANAVFAASGRRLRELPLRLA